MGLLVWCLSVCVHTHVYVCLCVLCGCECGSTCIRTCECKSEENIQELVLTFYLVLRRSLSCSVASWVQQGGYPQTSGGCSYFCLPSHPRNRDLRCIWAILAFYVAHRGLKSSRQACITSVFAHRGIFGCPELTVFEGVFLLGSPRLLYFCVVMHLWKSLRLGHLWGLF